ncbi:hypothetical protein D3C73_1037180 [compost metagenome]
MFNCLQRLRGDGGAADAMRAVAADNEIRLHGLGLSTVVAVAAMVAVVAKVVIAHGGPRRSQVVQAYVGHLKAQVAARGQPRVNQVLDDFVLRIDHHGAAACQVNKINAPVDAAHAQHGPFVPESFAAHPVTQARFGHQVHRTLLQHTRADGGADGVAATAFQHHGFNALQIQQVRQHQPSRTGPYDCYLSAHAQPLLLKDPWRHPVRTGSRARWSAP